METALLTYQAVQNISEVSVEALEYEGEDERILKMAQEEASNE